MSVETPKIFFVKHGSGQRNLLLFHGFGQDHTVFLPMMQSLSNRYTCYIFDLYFHGKSVWPKGEEPLEKIEWIKILESILSENRIESFSVLGYSLGAKFAMATAEAFPEKTKELLLVAPDGIKTSSWYSLATYPIMLRKLFRNMIQHHSRFLSLARFLNSIHLLDKGLLRFAEQQMNTEDKRRQVYYSWVVFRHLKLNMEEIAEVLNHFQIPLTIVVGKFDKVIKPENMSRLLRHVKNHRLEIVEAGHNRLLGEELINILGSRE